MNTMPAEWQPHKQCWMAWPCNEALWPGQIEDVEAAYASVARAIAEFEPVVMVVRPADKARARRLLDPSIELIEMPLNDSWMRDMGPSFVITENGEKAGVNWVFNGWGKYPHEQDKLAAERVLNHAGLPRIDSALVNEGGAIHVDGEGTVLLTETVQLNSNRNPGLSKSDVEEKLADAIGATHFIWLPEGLVDDDTDGHIDELACFVAPGKVLALVSDDPDDDNYPRLQNNLELLRNSRDAKGRQLEVVTVNQPPAAYCDGVRLSRSYINFYIANGGVVMPRYGEPACDQAAFEVMKQCFPDRNVVQVDCSTIVKGGGNIHCITQQEPVV